MRKILIIGLVVVFTLTLTSVSFAGGRHPSGHRGGRGHGGHGHGGHNNAGAILAGGLILGAGVLIGSVLSRPASPPVVYYPPPPSPPSAYYPPSPQGYYLNGLNGATVIVEMKTWYNESIRMAVEDGLRSRGAIVIAVRQQRIDAVYVVEVYTQQDSYYATVQIRIIRTVDGVVCATGTGQAAFYYDGSDQWRSFQWAASRALANLR